MLHCTQVIDCPAIELLWHTRCIGNSTEKLPLSKTITTMTKPASPIANFARTIRRCLGAAALVTCLAAAQPAAAAGLSPVFEEKADGDDVRARLRVSPTWVVALGGDTTLSASALSVVDFERFIRELSKELDAARATATLAATTDAL